MTNTNIKQHIPPVVKDILRPFYRASKKAVSFSKKKAADTARKVRKDIVLRRHGKGKVSCVLDLTGRDYVQLPKRDQHLEKYALLKTLLEKTPKQLVSHNVLDILSLQEKEKDISKYFNVEYLFFIQDPREIISQTNPHAPGQFSTSAHQSLFINGDIISFSNPGLLHYFDMMQTVSNKQVFKIEDTPDQAHSKEHEEIYCLKIPTDKTAPWWKNPARVARVLDQIEIFPEIETMCQTLGYAPTHEIMAEHSIQDPRRKPEKGTIIAFHTDDEIYTAEAKRFASRILELGLSYEITTIPSKKDWTQNCAYKPRIIQTYRDSIQGPLLYVDVDAYVHQDPWNMLHLHENADLAAHIDRDGELQSGTLLINDTQGARDVLKAWVAAQEEAPNQWDQRTLQSVVLQQDALPTNQRKFIFQRLSPSMTFILDKQYPYMYDKPIVEHLQVSRETHHVNTSQALLNRRTRLAQLFKKQ